MPGLDCACGSGRRYPECCRPFHRGEREAGDAEALVRSRFSAFALGNAGYLRKTLHPDHEDSRLLVEESTSDVRRAARVLRYRSVRILDQAGTPEGARVVFLARIFQAGKERSFVECSELVRDPGSAGLRYRSGVTRAVSEIKGDPAALRLKDFA